MPYRGPPQDSIRLVVLIPAYNEEYTIASVIESIHVPIPGIDEVMVVVIDDGSTDNTAASARSAGAMVVSHPQNRGLADAFRTGIAKCLELRANLAVSIDADLQFSTSDIPRLIEPILNGSADFVAGNRFADGIRPENMPKVKYFGNHIMTYLVSQITGNKYDDVSSGYRAYSYNALLNLNVQSSFTYTQESFIELAAKGITIAQIPVQVTYYRERKSRVVRGVLRYSIRTFLTIARTTRDYAPLSIFGMGAIALLAPGLLLLLFIFSHFLATGAFTPYIFVAFTSIYLITAGCALFALGLVADMLRGTRTNQERMLYFMKRNYYGEPNLADRESD